MPLYPNGRDLIIAQLKKIQSGEKVAIIEIGTITDAQHIDINARRSRFGLPGLEQPRIVYLGRHHYNSRLADRYCITDMADQLESGLASNSVVIATHYMTALQNKTGRADNYGNFVRDMVILELTSRKPRGEAYSAIPRGDTRKPE